MGAPNSTSAAVQGVRTAAADVDGYAQLFVNWGDPTPDDVKALAPYLPNYAAHLTNAKAHASNWTTQIRPGIVALLTSLGSFYDSFNLTSVVALRSAIRTIKAPTSTPQQVADAEQTIADILQGIIDGANSNLTTTKTLIANTTQLGANIATDMTLLQGDFQKATDVGSDLTADRASLEDLNTQKAAAQREYHTEIGMMVAGAVVLAVGLVTVAVTVVVAAPVAGQTAFAAAAGTTAFSIGCGISGAGITWLVGAAPGLVAAQQTLAGLETKVNALNAKIAGEDAGYAATLALRTHFGAFSDKTGDVVSSLTSITTALGAIPADLQTLKRDALDAKFADPTELEHRLLTMAADFGTLKSDCDVLTNLMTTQTVQTVTSAPVSSITAEAA
ncbi:MAG: alpha-helical pore-forming toxin family protein [Planctomycetes bacterium]|nr:alpha-helical pore-forming toxin family protein [Planctomycetota bacterium]